MYSIVLQVNQTKFCPFSTRLARKDKYNKIQNTEDVVKVATGNDTRSEGSSLHFFFSASFKELIIDT